MLAFQNSANVLVVVDPEDYHVLIEHLQGKGDVEEGYFRIHLRGKARRCLALHNSAIREWLWNETSSG